MHRSKILAGKREFLFSIIASVGTATLLPIQSGYAGNHEHGPIYRTLDALAGGIEKVIDVAAAVKQRGSSSAGPLCDDACDAMMMDELTALPPYDVMPPGAVEYAAPGFSDMTPPQEMMPPETLSPAPTRDQSSRRLMAPRMPSPPADMSRGKRPAQAPPAAAPATRGADDEWIESFSTESERPNGSAVPRRATDPQSKPKANPGALRSPAETYDSLPNPFMDDPQSRRVTKSVNRPASYWEPW
ncbi:MAG: hypothetical protein ACO1RT_19790 [Planctomycetaceae bacterium]